MTIMTTIEGITGPAIRAIDRPADPNFTPADAAVEPLPNTTTPVRPEHSRRLCAPDDATLDQPRSANDPATPTADAMPEFLGSRRADGWSAGNQRIFLEAIGEGIGVEMACLRVGLSTASAYAFRRTAKGAAFALGWRAAALVARDTLAEMLLSRALDGQVETLVRADGSRRAA